MVCCFGGVLERVGCDCRYWSVSWVVLWARPAGRVTGGWWSGVGLLSCGFGLRGCGGVRTAVAFFRGWFVSRAWCVVGAGCGGARLCGGCWAAFRSMFGLLFVWHGSGAGDVVMGFVRCFRRAVCHCDGGRFLSWRGVMCLLSGGVVWGCVGVLGGDFAVDGLARFV